MRITFALAALAAVFSGCASIQDCHYEMANHLRTECAWLGAAPSSLAWVWPSDYGHGWKEGYYNVAMGGVGKPPTVPPDRYWSPCYQDCDGQQRVAAWYEGFQDGALYAEQHGAGAFHYLHPYGLHGTPCSTQEPPSVPAYSNDLPPANTPMLETSPATSPSPSPANNYETLPRGDAEGEEPPLPEPVPTAAAPLPPASPLTPIPQTSDGLSQADRAPVRLPPVAVQISDLPRFPAQPVAAQTPTSLPAREVTPRPTVQRNNSPQPAAMQQFQPVAYETHAIAPTATSRVAPEAAENEDSDCQSFPSLAPQQPAANTKR